MAVRREPTDAELRAKYLRDTENARLRMRALRARRKTASRNAENVRVTNTAPGGAGDANPPTPPVVSFSLTERKKVEHLLATFVERGYKHDPRFWELVRARYPHLDLELEVLKLAEWLDEPRNAKRKCSKGFIANWLSKADVDRQQREAQARTLPPTGQSGSGQAPRPSPGRPPDPAPVLPADAVLERIDPAAAARHLLDAKRLTLPEKLAAIARNGRAG